MITGDTNGGLVRRRQYAAPCAHITFNGAGAAAE